jgi:two-component system sensor histidine kinase/response regulator
MASLDFSTSLILDPVLAAEARAARMRQFNTMQVPALRLLGFMFNAIAILINNRFVLRTLTLHEAVFDTSVLMAYSLAAWMILYLFWERVRVVDLSDVFLVCDLVVLMFVVYVSGANRSMLWIVFAARVADQVAMTFRRALVFAHLGPLAYAVLIIYVVRVEHRPVDWGLEFCKLLFLYILCLYMSITARTAQSRRRKFSEARRIAERAVREAAERQQALEDALTRLETANRAKSEFLANVSHEIRTPLNSVIGTSDALLDSPLSREQRDMLSVVRESAASLTLLVDDLLDLARLEARRVSIETIPMRLREILTSTVRMFAVRAHQQGLELVCHVARDVPDALLGDPHRLRQVLTNLLGNAVKFTSKGEVVLRVELDDREAPDSESVRLRCSVRDSGIGIPASRQHAIFEAFTQVDGSSTRRYGGTGLGLTIAADLVALMGGRLWVNSEEGLGSTFTFLATFGRGAADPPSRAPWGARPITALVADPSDAARTSAAEILAGWGAQVLEAKSFSAATAALDLADARRRPVDLALVDASLPGLDGPALAARLGAGPGTVNRLVLLIRAHQQTADAERALALGATFLVKPVTAPTLSDVIAPLFAEVPAGGPTAPAPHPARPLRILIVDDHVVNQAVASAPLRKWGHAVAVASNGAEALQRLATEPYDLVLMDLQMPLMDGLQATRAIRENESGTARRVPIVAMTARAMDEDRERCRAAGMDGLITKPLDQRELFATLERLAPPAPETDPLRPAAEPKPLTPLISDPALMRHVAELFLQTAPEQIDRLRDALARRDAVLTQSIAHAVRGAMSNFSGASTRAASRLESLAEAGSLDRADAAFAEMRIEVDRLMLRLRAFLEP